jgi:hypothetical protein
MPSDGALLAPIAPASAPLLSASLANTWPVGAQSLASPALAGMPAYAGTPTSVAWGAYMYDMTTPVGASPDRRTVHAMYTAAFIVALLMLFGGVVGTIIAPSNLTKLGVPLGLTLWAILAWLLSREDQSRLNER